MKIPRSGDNHGSLSFCRRRTGIELRNLKSLGVLFRNDLIYILSILVAQLLNCGKYKELRTPLLLSLGDGVKSLIKES